MSEETEQDTRQVYVAPTIVNGQEPALFAWRSPENILFLLGKDPVDDPGTFISDISLEQLFELDPGLREVAELPAGFRAYRGQQDKAWKIAQVNPKTGQGQYLDGYLEWINKMYVDGYFTGGTVPHFYTFPGKPRLYGWIAALAGLILLGTTFIIGRLNKGSIAENPLGPAIAGLFFLFIGVSILLRSKRS